MYAGGDVTDYHSAPIGAEGFLFEGELTQNPPVQVGNIVYVPPMDGGSQVFVLGEVRTPGAYPVEPGREVRLVELIACAGGTTPTADLAGVRIYARGDVTDYEARRSVQKGFSLKANLSKTRRCRWATSCTFRRWTAATRSLY